MIWYVMDLKNNRTKKKLKNLKAYILGTSARAKSQSPCSGHTPMQGVHLCSALSIRRVHGCLTGRTPSINSEITIQPLLFTET